MMKRLAALTFATLLASACGNSDADLLALDDEAAAAEADGKADGVTGIVRLERATPDEVSDAFTARVGTALDVCAEALRAAYPDEAITDLTPALADRFIDVAIRTNDGACDDWSTLQEVVDGVLAETDATAAPVDAIVAGIPAWSLPQLQAAAPEGFVEAARAPLTFYDDLLAVQDANARARERDPAGMTLAGIRDAWDEVGRAHNLDRAFLAPVTFPDGVLDGTRVFTYLRAAFPLRRLSLVSAGRDAVTDFGTAYDGPDGHPAWEDDIAAKLKKSSIRKRFYFSGGGSEWTSNVLIVVDQHGQAWGFQIGYSE